MATEDREPDRLAQQMEHEADEMQARDDELRREQDEIRQDWERKRRDESVPGAPPPPEEDPWAATSDSDSEAAIEPARGGERDSDSEATRPDREAGGD